MNFRRDIFRPALGRTGRFRYYDLGRGTGILESDEDIDTYIVAYGPGHYQKLMDALTALNVQSLCRFQVEIIDWGCGIALGAWCFLKSMELEQESLTAVQRITLIDPSWRCIVRGITYIADLATENNVALPTLNIVTKTLSELQPSDLISGQNSVKVHIFSNILDIQDINLAALHRLIVNHYPGYNMIVATSPYNMNRLDDFLALFQRTHDPRVASDTSEPVACWRYRTTHGAIVSDDEVQRVEKVFSVRIA